MLLALVLVTGCSSGKLYSDQEISDALEELRPNHPGFTWAEYVVSCALENGFSAEVKVDPLGSIEYGEVSEHDREIMEGCVKDAGEVFAFPELEDKKLEDAVMYQLQVHAAECVETELGLDPRLPSLETYVDSGGRWNMYDNAEPVDEAQWIEWNQTCPQDLWHYYDQLTDEDS